MSDFSLRSSDCGTFNAVQSPNTPTKGRSDKRISVWSGRIQDGREDWTMYAPGFEMGGGIGYGKAVCLPGLVNVARRASASPSLISGTVSFILTVTVAAVLLVG